MKKNSIIGLILVLVVLSAGMFYVFKYDIKVFLEKEVVNVGSSNNVLIESYKGYIKSKKESNADEVEEKIDLTQPSEDALKAESLEFRALQADVSKEGLDNTVNSEIVKNFRELNLRDFLKE